MAENIKVLATNRKASFEYFLMERFEAGLALQGTEIKSIRAGQVSLAEAYVEIVDGREAWLVEAHIAPYAQGNRFNHDPKRKRRLLLHKKQIRELWNNVRLKGMTIVPVRIYLKEGRAKIEIALARGKKAYDKRATIAKRDQAREAEREITGQVEEERMLGPSTIGGINKLPEDEKRAIYARYIPRALLQHFDLPEPDSQRIQSLLKFKFEPGSSDLEMSLYHEARFPDPILYAHLVDTMNGQIHILLYILNDPDSPRFNVDRLPDGTPTRFGTAQRNLEAEAAALQAGLAPGQVRRGLRMLGEAIETFEGFITSLGHDMWFAEPLYYHNAVLFERYGFSYQMGKRQMENIQSGFQAEGSLAKLLDGSTPFRQPGAANSIRLRSWAIHDGLLGEPFTNVTMYKRVGKHAGINTTSGCDW